MAKKKFSQQETAKGVKLDARPFFTVIIASFNRADLITRALDSLVSQTEKDWEAIIVDDGSTDDTHCRVKSYLKKHLAIKYISEQHKGMTGAKNTGIRLSSGRYITFLDSDDEYEPTHLESRKTILEQHPAVRFLHGGVKIIGNPYVPDRFNPGKKINLDECVIGGTFIIEKNSAVLLGGYRDIVLGSDGDLFDRVKSVNLMILKVSTPTYIYHHETEDSITNRLLTGQSLSI